MTNLIGQSLGRYTIVEQLGEGGMALVYKAFDTRLERDVAIKIIRRGAFPPDQLDQILKRFEREAKSLGRLSHPNIVKVYDYGEHDGSPFLVLEYLQSGTLKGKLQKLGGKPLPWQEAVQIILPIARALHFAHERGIIHRDIKPSNILITLSGEPMLSDFGIAKILDSSDTTSLTGSNATIGTPEYMAPEQWSGMVTTRSDQYSLGVVLYEMVTGRKPYTADTPAAILLKQATEPLPRPREFNGEIPGELEMILLKTLSHQAEERYPSILELLAELERLPRFTDERTTISPRSIDSVHPKDQHSQQVDTPAIPTPILELKTEEPSHQVQSPRKKKSWIWIPSGLFLITAITILVILLGNDKVSKGESTPTLKLEITATQGVQLTKVPSEETMQVTDTPEPSPTIAIITTTRTEDGMVMVQIPEGEFTMGMDADESFQNCQLYRSDCEISTFLDADPAHPVFLDTYWIDQTEITNSMYAKCVNAGICKSPKSNATLTRQDYYKNPEYSNFPVLHIDWFSADTYCGWVNARLPTEAEWEKAARGTDSRSYPWGNEAISCDKANFTSVLSGRSCVGDTSEAGFFSEGASPYGVLDLSGNVAEWVNDYYASDYYANSPYLNPQGPSSSDLRILRGGAWNFGENDIRTVTRFEYYPGNTFDPIGFRCARSVP